MRSGKRACERLEVEAEFGGEGARREVVRAGERREEVIERVFVGDVDGGEVEAPFVLVAAEEVVLAQRGIEDVAWCDALRVVVVVAGVGRGD